MTSHPETQQVQEFLLTQGGTTVMPNVKIFIWTKFMRQCKERVKTPTYC